ncbi:MAG TPA: methyl-accepting chemotaxis protein [Myxococcales bacterium LLY-WYZ-16_1]|nr:methyl-accepting chemotaxis protein [Myxococcales bacterium LLY-WYZ-16_1]
MTKKAPTKRTPRAPRVPTDEAARAFRRENALSEAVRASLELVRKPLGFDSAIAWAELHGQGVLQSVGQVDAERDANRVLHRQDREPAVEAWNRGQTQRDGAVVCVPVEAFGQRVGAFEFRRSSGSFTPTQVKAQETFVVGLSNAYIDRLRRSELEAEVTDLQTLQTVLAAVEESEDFESAVTTVLNEIRSAFDWAYGSFWRLDREKRALVFDMDSGSVSSEFRAASERAEFREGAGIDGRAWSQKGLVEVEDLGQVRDCPRREPAERAGVKSGFAFPVVWQGEVVGTVDFFSTRSLVLSPSRRRILEELSGGLTRTLERMAREQERREAEKRSAVLESALDNANKAFMLIDRDLVITYANKSTQELMRANEAVLRETFPGFRADGLVGTCIDIFHKDPAHQRGMLADRRNLPHSTTITVGPLKFAITVSAVTDKEGNYVGNTMEWDDVTLLRKAEDQIKSLIDEASAGQLDARLDVEGWDGFVKEVGVGVNALLDQVVTPVKELKENLGAIASGNLVAAMSEAYRGEFAEISAAFNATATNLRGVVDRIRTAASAISEGSTQISAGNNDLSTRTQGQAAALEETAATVEELTGTVRQNANNAREANQLASGARNQAEEGGEVVSNAVDAMQAIAEASKKIADIIGVIDEIAFQTNLLALNAAVEAARAGEQGRGFAVVATEVRNLAQRSATAAKEIKALIKDSGEKVDEGCRLVDASGETLRNIVGSVKKVSDIVAEISAASDDQATAIEQVNQAVTQMDSATQQNAGLVEEAAAASMSLSDEATQLKDLVAYFQTGERQEGEGESNGKLSRPAREAPAASPRSKPAASATESKTVQPAVAAAGPSAGAPASDEHWTEF